MEGFHFAKNSYWECLSIKPQIQGAPTAYENLYNGTNIIFTLIRMGEIFPAYPKYCNLIKRNTPYE